MFNEKYASIIEKIRFDEYNYELDCDKLEEQINNYGFVCKDVFNGDIIKVIELTNSNTETFSLLCENGIEISCNIKKERKFFERYDIIFNDMNSLSEWLCGDESKEWFKSHEIFISIESNSYKINGSLINAYNQEIKNELFKQIKNTTNTYECTILERNHGGFIVDIKGIKAFMPGSLASANKIINFDSYIGTKVLVMVEDYLKEGETFIVSNKKYINKILPEIISKLDTTIKYNGEITGTKKFGIFIEFENIVTGLLHTSEMTEDTLQKFNNGEYTQGNIIDFYIKDILGNKIILTEIETNIEKEVTLLDFKTENENTYKKGRIVNIQNYGCFLNFKYKNKIFTGLYHIKQFSNNFMPILNDEITVYIDNVSVDDNKIHLKNPNYTNE